MTPCVAQKIDVIERGEPFRVVGHDRVMFFFAEIQEPGEDAVDPLFIGGNRLQREQLTARVLARGIADPCRAAAHERDRLATGLLQPAQEHDLNERAGVERRRRAVETGIGNELSRFCYLIEHREIGALMQKATLDEHGEEAGMGTKIAGHGKPSAKGSRRCNKGARSPRIYETVRFRGKGAAMQRAAARRLGRKGEDPSKTYMCTARKLRRIAKLLLVGAAVPRRF